MFENKIKRSIKNILILGDSYSTFGGYIPEGYAAYYTDKGREDNDVKAVSETWWHLLCRELDLNLVLNNSWSGSTVGYTGYGNSDCSHTSSFIFRLKQLIEKGFFKTNKIDTVFIFGATNDSWSGAPLGKEKFDNFEQSDLFCVLPAISYLIKKLTETLPDSNVVYIINTDLKPEITNTIINACELFGASYIALKDITKIKGHPTVLGMAEIKKQIVNFIKS